MESDNDPLKYHTKGRPGKIEVVPTKPLATAKDLSLAYSPGVAVPCLEIAKKEGEAYKYTSKSNLVGVISNGSAVLGLGNIGAQASKPVMEGKGCLFKKFADVDVFDIELNTGNVDEFVRAVQLLEPTFGGINLEDIKAPECFYIEEQLKKKLSIPVMHDDQHGTAIITGAALLNALKIAKKKIKEIKVVVVGAGAAGIACAKFYVSLGVQKRNILMIDREGVIYKGRKKGMNKYKQFFANSTKKRTLEEAMQGADVFLGVSKKGLLTKDMVRSMNNNPIVFALANPDPEITYKDATSARDDIIMATGRSDYPNQVNNVLGFPFIFRGALDVQAKAINEDMKIAAAKALAELAKEEVPEEVSRAYGNRIFKFGKEYIIPKPFDQRVLYYVAPAVAKAAMKSKIARKKINIKEYTTQLELRVNRSKRIMHTVHEKAKHIHHRRPTQLVFADGDSDRVLRACEIIEEEKIATPVVLGDKDEIYARVEQLGLTIHSLCVVDPKDSPIKTLLVEELMQLRGVSKQKASNMLMEKSFFGAMMVRQHLADGFLTGARTPYADAIRPVLQIIKPRKGISKASGLYVIASKERILFFADTTVNVDPSAKQLTEIVHNTSKLVRYFNMEPKVAMLSFANSPSAHNKKMTDAMRLIKKQDKTLKIDGPMQVDSAVNEKISRILFPKSPLQGDANVLIFPNLEAANIGYKLMHRVGMTQAIGPMLMGMEHAVNIISQASSSDDIVHLAALTVVQSADDLC